MKLNMFYRSSSGASLRTFFDLRRGVLAPLLLAPCLLLGACGDSPTAPPMPLCPGPMMVEGSVERPVKISAPPPQYTEEARRARIQGVVILQAIIDCEGNVVEIMVLQGLSHGLTESAVDAVSRWRFEPARQNGMPVSVHYNLTINFQLQ